MPVTISGTTGIQTPGVANSGTSTAALFSGPLIGNASTATLATTIADSSVTTSKLALSAVTADRINLVTSLSSNGYQIMPGGLIMQWGTSDSLAGDGNQTLNFPIAFPTACLRAFASITNSSTTNDDIFGRVISYSRTQITVRAEAAGVASGSRSVEYLAIGF
ncbi:MAG: hypothetical protein EB127_08255 [Alphaproteobacteria bacterium]|nr:hypothetical protein [Alphaproteobacteria bacterium]